MIKEIQILEKALEREQIKNGNLHYKIKKIEEVIEKEGGVVAGYVYYLRHELKTMEEVHCQQNDTIAKYEVMLNKEHHDTIEV